MCIVCHLDHVNFTARSNAYAWCDVCVRDQAAESDSGKHALVTATKFIRVVTAPYKFAFDKIQIIASVKYLQVPVVVQVVHHEAHDEANARIFPWLDLKKANILGTICICNGFGFGKKI